MEPWRDGRESPSMRSHVAEAQYLRCAAASRSLHPCASSSHSNLIGRPDRATAHHLRPRRSVARCRWCLHADLAQVSSKIISGEEVDKTR